MKIRGNTVGTPIKPEKVLVKSENLTGAEKAKARENIGAVAASDLPKNVPLDNATYTAGQYVTNGTVQSGASYGVWRGLQVKAGKTYVIAPAVRFAELHNAGTFVEKYAINGGMGNEPQFVKPTQDGELVFTTYAKHEGSVSVTEYAYSLLNFGDSIGAGDGNGSVGYSEMIGEIDSAWVVDAAVGGYTISRIEGNSNSVLSRIEMNGAWCNVSPDIILLEGGSNDYTQTRQMGELSGNLDFAGTYDETTYIGALESAFYKIRTKWADAQIIWVFSHRQNSRTEKTVDGVTVNYKTMHDMSIEACKKWGIPVVDLFEEGCMNTLWPHDKTKYTKDADGTHPNELGYMKFYVPRILAKIRELLSL